MKIRRIAVWIALALMVAIPSAGILYVLGAPCVLAVAPAPGTTDVPAGAAVRITFSRSMQPQAAERLAIDPPQAGQVAWQGRGADLHPGRALAQRRTD